ncbi:MAG: hypothetical protein Q4G50_09895 [Corynebacterium sp.]|uniref:hypothetical protein n=1 Tax=Corynebacterium sp. TaxID=1720 RepID=UPI0026DEA6D7|nr:hypothetical protein [Corynebacterium sp.]MDO5670305.1 hypothetical protein [Corynebacterium sp.]
MTRSERRNLLAILSAIVLIIVGIITTVIFGVKGPEAESGQAQATEQAVSAEATPTEQPNPVAESRVNRIHRGAVEAPDAFADLVHIRSWDGEMTVWPGSAQIVLGPEENWFPAGHPACGEGRYVVAFSATSALNASLRDEVGESTTDAEATNGWMLLDDCHTPYLTAPESQAEVDYEVHEYQPVS